MVVGVLYVEMHFPGVTNLKAKRRILQSIKSNVRNKFNASISEVAYHDLWQRCALGAACVSPDYNPVERELNRILEMIDENPELEVAQHSIEYIRPGKD